MNMASAADGARLLSFAIPVTDGAVQHCTPSLVRRSTSAENLIAPPICPSGASKWTTGLVLGRTDELTSGVRIELRTFAWTLCFCEYLHLTI